MDELLPCPFCGKEPVVDNKAAVEGEPVLIYCQNCYENTGRTVDAIADDLKESIKAWNTRKNDGNVPQNKSSP